MGQPHLVGLPARPGVGVSGVRRTSSYFCDRNTPRSSYFCDRNDAPPRRRCGVASGDDATRLITSGDGDGERGER
jgi:hypothetical protein